MKARDMDDAQRADMYRRQLGGMTANHAKRKKRIEQLEAENKRLRARIAELEGGAR